MQVGAYVDDLAVLEVRRRDEHSAPDSMGGNGGRLAGIPTDAATETAGSCAARWARQAEVAYSLGGAKVKESKKVDAALKATVWGSEVDGAAGTVGTPAKKVVELARLTVDVLHTGYGDYRVLSRLVGSWNPVLMHARAAFAILERAFVLVADLSARPEESVRIPPRVWGELALLVIVAPVMVTNLRSPVAQWLYLTAASLQRGGITRARLSPTLGAELWRFADLRGRHSWLAPRSVYYDVIAKLGRELSPVEAAFSAIAATLPHCVVANYRFRTPTHITLKECLVYRTLMVHAGAELSLHDHPLGKGS